MGARSHFSPYDYRSTEKFQVFSLRIAKPDASLGPHSDAKNIANTGNNNNLVFNYSRHWKL